MSDVPRDDTSDPHHDLPAPSTSPTGLRPAGRPRWQHIVVLLLTSMVAAVLATDLGRVPAGSFESGDIAPRTVKAPFSYTFQDLETWEAARDAAGEATRAVWMVDPSVPSTQAMRVVQAFRAGREALGGVDPSTLDDTARSEVVRRFLDAGAFSALSPEDVLPLVAAGFPAEAEAGTLAWLDEAYDRDRLILSDAEQPGGAKGVRVLGFEDGHVMDLDDPDRLATVGSVRGDMTLESLRLRRAGPWSGSVLALAQALVRPNVVHDASATESARAEARARVAPEPIRVQRGETLFREGDRLTERDVARYRALQHSRTDHNVMLGLISRFGLISLSLLLLWGAGRTLRMQRHGEDPWRSLIAWTSVLALSLGLLRVVVTMAPGIARLVGNEAQTSAVWLAAPLLGGVLLVSELMGVRRALWWVLSAIVPVALIVQFDAAYATWLLITGVAAAGLSTSVRDRVDVIRAGLQAGAMGGAFMVLVHFVTLYGADGELSLATTIRPMWSLLFAMIGGVLSGFLVLGLVPVFERFGFVTDHRMMELASLNHPLMRQLMLRAPGTYHHSVVVGTLAEAACDAIGANGTQAKIAAYFHDIGKVHKPTFFVENQAGGANRHGELDPVTSAEIILSHVTEGARMAREHHLPQPIIDNILMHHGTGLLQFFFAKAQMQADDPSTVDETRFRYPGPKPSTREAGVIMLADKVEAATRTIQHPNEEAIRAMIQRIVNSVMADGQFTECPLTFREIHDVVEVFVKVLLGIYHQRIEYPQTRALSRPPTGSAEAPQAAVGKGAPGTITLELEAGEELGAFVRTSERTDEITDYEAVRNLPQGRGG